MAKETEINIDGITPQTAKKLLAANTKVVVSRLSKGKPLSKSDRLKLEEIASLDDEGESGNFVAGWEKLAQILGVTRRTLQTWRKKKGAPKPNKDGKHNVDAWLEFVNADKLDQFGKDFREQKLRILKAQANEREFRLGILEEKYVEIDGVRETWSAHVHQAIALMRSKFENELPPLYTLDPVDNMKLNQQAIDEICKTMSDGGKYTP